MLVRRQATERENRQRSFHAAERARLSELLAIGTVPTDERDLKLLGAAADFNDEAAELFTRHLESARDVLRERQIQDMRPTRAEAMCASGLITEGE